MIADVSGREVASHFLEVYEAQREARRRVKLEFQRAAHAVSATVDLAALQESVQRSGTIVAIPILAGLHHQYVRI
jgi:hypothetical protein